LRIWDISLIEFLCDKHLLAVWREGLGAYSIITNNKKGYSKHPAVLEYKKSPTTLWYILKHIREKMTNKQWKPKELPMKVDKIGKIKIWQTIEQQIEILNNKNCKCNIKF
jgi:hypothetical protein